MACNAVVMADMRNAARRILEMLRATARGRLVVRVAYAVVEINVVDRAMTLSAQAFTSLVPVMMAIGTLGAMDSVAETLESDYGLDLRDMNGAPTSSAAAFGAVGVLMLVVSATSFARALGRIYGHIWSHPVVAYRQGWRWILVVIVLSIGAAAVGAARSLADVPSVGPVLVYSSQFALWFVVWTAVPTLLVRRGIPFRARWSTGVLTAAGLTALQMGSVIVLPRVMNSAEQQFGYLGMMFTLIGWLFVYMAIVVIAAVVVRSSTRQDSAVVGCWPPDTQP